ncbi:MAG: COG1361 S-layer family protein [Thermoplasmatota archaeon]
MKRSTLWLSLLAAVAVAVPAVQATPVVSLATTVVPTAALPGTMGDLQLSFKNSGDAVASALEIQILSVDQGILLNTTYLNLGSLDIGATLTTNLPFSVPATTAPGYYNVHLLFQYYYPGGNNGVNQVATIPVHAPPSLVVRSVSPAQLQPGAVTAGNFTLANTGTATLTNLDATWSATAAAVLPVGTSNEFQLATITPGAVVQIPVTLEASAAATPGLVSLTFKLSYNDNTGLHLNGTSTVGVVVGGPTEFDVSIQDVTGTAVTVAVTNTGVNAATGVVVRAVPGGIPLTGGPAVLGPLAAGDYITATFQLPSTFNGTGRVRGGGFGGGQTGTASPVGGNGFGGGFGNRSFSRSAFFQVSYTDSTGARQSQTLSAPLPPASGRTAAFGSGAPRSTAASVDFVQVGAGAAGMGVLWAIAAAVRRRRTVRLMSAEQP